MSNVEAVLFGDERAADGVAVDILGRSRSRELFFAVVGPVGAGGSRVIDSLKRVGEASGYQCEVIKASELIRKWAAQNRSAETISAEKTLSVVEKLQDLGDEMRRRDSAAVARHVMREIAMKRAEAQKIDYVRGQAVLPDMIGLVLYRPLTPSATSPPSPKWIC
ncbi:hypothetical protein [Ensifer aridi]|uniref:hypothetical protein n=1 Tax=Ensifer aridi TaxID=1708715 RepID=UPI0004204845|nr:hypothetical protein [Ensifer aridi]